MKTTWTAPSAVLSIVATSYFFKVATKVSFLSSALFLTMAYCFKRIGNLIIHAILSSISKEQPRWGSTKANMAILEQVSSVLSVGAAFKLANLTRYGITVAGATNAGLALAGVAVTGIIFGHMKSKVIHRIDQIRDEETLLMPRYRSFPVDNTRNGTARY